MTADSSSPQTLLPAIEQALSEAVERHRAGNLQEAEKGYRHILQIDPAHAQANHNLGALYVQMGQAAAGLAYHMAALDADPAHAKYWLGYIDALFQAGQTEDARQVLVLARQSGLQGAEVETLHERLEGGAQVSEPSIDKPRHSSSVTSVPHAVKQNANGKPVKQGKPLSRQESGPGSGEINDLVKLFNEGRLAETIILAKGLTERHPLHGFGWKALGTALKQMGRNAEALAPMQQAAALSPNEADAHSNLGVTLQDMGRLDEAEASYRRAVKINPNYAEAYCNLGTMLQDMGRLDEAEASHRRALKINPNLAEAHYNLGNTLRARGRLAEAADNYRKALKIKPAYVQACCNLGAALNDQGRLDEAEAMLRRALEIKPDHVEACGNLGNTLKELGRLSEAEACYRRALALKPNLAEVHNNLGILLQDTGRLAEAESSYRHALELDPDYFKAYSNLLFLLNYNPAIAPVQALDEARRYGERVARKATSRFTKWTCAKQPKRLRIGLVSGDFRNHPVGYFLENLLRHLDRNSFELIAYPTDSWRDELTERIRPLFSAWKPLAGLGDAAAAKLIHGDGVHILIDLSGHSRYNRLPMFAWKPAPVQVAWLGYFATTGVAEMDYLIADAATLPETEEKHFTEKIWRLPETRLCFTPPEVDVSVSSLPALTNGYITFGCFNNLSKMNDGVVALWSRVLASVPGSRLFLKSKQLGDASVRQSTLARFAAHGIATERLLLEGAESREKYFAAYRRVDIALDPFPYPGGTTTVESLWMGVPVLNLAGKSFLFRQGAGFLTNAGLPEWIADSQDDYVRRAADQAANLPHLAQLRMRLRQQAAASPLMDGERFAGYFSAALQVMWQAREEKQQT